MYLNYPNSNNIPNPFWADPILSTSSTNCEWVLPNSQEAINVEVSLFAEEFDFWSQSYDRELQRQRCKNSQIYNATSSLVGKLLQRLHCSCKFQSRRIDFWKTVFWGLPMYKSF
jgi:hypothetical protein